MVGEDVATKVCDLGYYLDPDNITCYVLKKPQSMETFGTANLSCNDGSVLLSFESEEQINGFLKLLNTSK